MHVVCIKLWCSVVFRDHVLHQSMNVDQLQPYQFCSCTYFVASRVSHSQLGRTKRLQSLHSTKLRVSVNQGNKEDDFNFSSFKLQSLLYRWKIWFFLDLVKTLARLQNTKVQGRDRSLVLQNSFTCFHLRALET